MKKAYLALVLALMILMASCAMAANPVKTPVTKKFQINIQVLDKDDRLVKGAKVSVADKPEVYEKKLQQSIYGLVIKPNQAVKIKFDRSSAYTDYQGNAAFNLNIIYNPETISKINAAKLKISDQSFDFLISGSGFADKKKTISVDVKPYLNPQPEPPDTKINAKVIVTK